MLCSLALISVLTACGGGGGGGGETAAATTATTAPTAPTVTTSTPAATAASATAAAASEASAAADATTSSTAGAPRNLADNSPAPAAAPAAPGYYVDANSGNDSNPGSVLQPWKTLARAAGVRLQAGQGLYLRCGSVWRESLALSAVQLVDGSIVAGYGKECATSKAVISAADDFTGGWALEGGVWSRSLPAGTPKITQLFIDSQAMRTAQWPDPDSASSSPRMALISSAAASSGTGTATGNGAFSAQAADAAALAGRDLAGATVHIRTHPWLIETRRVSGFANGTLQLDNATIWAVVSGQGFVLQDKRWMLDKAGEFFHDVAAQRLYLIAPAGFNATAASLNAARIEGSVRDEALAISQRSGVVVRQLALRAARDVGLNILRAPGASVQQVEASDNAMAGVRVQNTAVGSTPTTVADSQLAGNGRFGIEATDSPNMLVARNVVRATGNAPHQVANTIAAIATGPGSRTEDNLVDGTGYIGISFSAQGGSVVTRNTVMSSCTRLVDCAGIYAFTSRARLVEGQTSTVNANRVLGNPAQAGTFGASANDIIVGIYVDDFSDGVTVADNLVAEVPIGVMVHNASRVTVRNNRLWLVRRTGIWATMDQTDGDWMRQNVFESNQIIPVVQAQSTAGAPPTFTAGHAVWFWHTLDGAAALGGARNLFRDNSVIQTQGPLAVHAWVHGGGRGDNIDAARWMQLNPGEKTPSRPARFTPILATLGAELVADSGLDQGLSQWSTWRSPDGAGFLAQGVAARAGCVGACMSFTAGSMGDLLASRPFVLKPGVPYAYRVALVASPASAGARLGAPYISRDVTPWDAMADGQGFTSYLSRSAAAGERLDHESYFVAKAAEPARVNIQLETTGANVGVDFVSVREVLGVQTAAPKDWARVVLAPAKGSAALSVGCAELGWPTGCTALAMDGTPATLPIAVAPGADLLLLRADSPFRR